MCSDVTGNFLRLYTYMDTMMMGLVFYLVKTMGLPRHHGGVLVNGWWRVGTGFYQIVLSLQKIVVLTKKVQ